ncbi:MAG: polymer-forming cytoskeletal protein [Gemmatimonadaceae bacterium]|nr:polymer-forming cytoskeletal protein [Gemmatimonadaceae bacterium]
MALWKEPVAPKRESALLTPDPITRRDDPTPAEAAPSYDAVRRTPVREVKESVIGSDITIEGKIDGTGHIRIAGRFKGDVHVEGNLTIEPGARLTGGVKANAVVIGGELEGNVIDAARVELQEGGVMNGDLKAGTFTVAAGSRMRGRVEFGWQDGNHRSPNGETGGDL